MFGFGRKPDHFATFLEYLIERWNMKARFAGAFLSAYRTDISVMHEGLKRLENSVPGQRIGLLRTRFQTPETLPSSAKHTRHT